MLVGTKSKYKRKLILLLLLYVIIYISILLVGMSGYQKVEYWNIMKLMYKDNVRFNERILTNKVHRKIRKVVQVPKLKDEEVILVKKKILIVELVHQ